VEGAVTKARREEVEARLEARLADLVRTRAAVRHKEDDSELAHLDNHPGDQASELHDEELDETTAMFLEEEANRIQEARRALEDGSYGRCKECGHEIPVRRLEAVPEAVRCLGCQQHFEGRHRQRAVL
jgi:RNA polymerase-binding transcription factor DksA